MLEFDPKFPCGKALEKIGAKRGDSVVLVQPSEVNEVMKKVPEGKLITLNGICKILAKKHKAQYCCTLTTGIFVTVAANAAEETGSNVPYWRTIKTTESLMRNIRVGQKSKKNS